MVISKFPFVTYKLCFESHLGSKSLTDCAFIMQLQHSIASVMRGDENFTRVGRLTRQMRREDDFHEFAHAPRKFQHS